MTTRARVKSIGARPHYTVGDVVEIIDYELSGFLFYRGSTIPHYARWQKCAYLDGGEWEAIDADGNVLAEKENE